MELFSSISVMFSIILGLGIANLLNSLVAMFRSRGHGRLHWMPLAWAACIFILQIQFWWAVIELRTLLTGWTFPQFLLLAAIPLLLYLAAALVIPDHPLTGTQKLLDEFHRDGQWALVALSLYALDAALIDHLFWNIPLTSWSMALLGAEFILPILNLATRRAWPEALSTAGFVLACIAGSISLSPGSYH